MMKTRTAEATWTGDLREGQGKMRLGSGTCEVGYSFGTRMGDTPGTNPEELIGAALAGCFSMAFSKALSQAGYDPLRVHTSARVKFGFKDGHYEIPCIELDMEAEVPEVDEAEFQRFAEAAKIGCPVSRALAGTDVTLNAKLVATANSPSAA
jgi:lipoyl-dependent peroxiredoxin